MKELLLISALLCTSCLKNYFDTNIDEHVATQFACRMLELTVQEKLKWNSGAGGAATNYSHFSTEFNNEKIWVTKKCIRLHFDHGVAPTVYIKNSCQKELHKYLSEKYRKMHEEKTKMILENYFNEVLK